MIYLFAGNDTGSKISAYQKFLKFISKDAEVFKFERNNFSPEEVAGFYGGSGLFGAKSVIVFSNILDYEETRSFILPRLLQMGEAENIFIFLEGKLNKETLDTFKKSRAELNIFELPKAKLERFDNFLLANAFGARDKLHLWIYFRQAVDLGVALEELIGVLFWKAKDMLLRKNFGKFREAELQHFAASLPGLLPLARDKGLDAEIVFEKFLLEAF